MLVICNINFKMFQSTTVLQMYEFSDEQAAGQYYLVCSTKDCQENGQFYCNDCHRPLCEQCRGQHLKNPDTQTHEIVPC